MNRIALLIVFPALLLIPNGCKAIMNFWSSSFLSNFSLEELVKKNRSPSGMMCAKGGMGGVGGGGSSVGPKQSSSVLFLKSDEELHPTCEAGGSIKPGVERSGTPVR
jgi:hypothetical protein